MAGTLLLDLDTLAGAPKFFALLALVERAATRRIVVVDADYRRLDGERLAAGFGVALERYIQLPKWADAPDRQRAKVTVAKSLRDKAPVIWVDTEFDVWDSKSENLSQLHNIITLNWGAVMRQGVAPEVKHA
jgi:hypothetical protein